MKLRVFREGEAIIEKNLEVGEVDEFFRALMKVYSQKEYTKMRVEIINITPPLITSRWIMGGNTVTGYDTITNTSMDLGIHTIKVDEAERLMKEREKLEKRRRENNEGTCAQD